MTRAKNQGHRWRVALAWCVLIGAAALSACGRSEPAAIQAPPADGPGYRVVTTVGMITDVARRVVGDRGEVVGLIGAGIDPHLYKPTRSDIQRLLSADVVFYNGLLLEGKMTDAFIRTARTGVDVIPVTETLDESYLLEPDGLPGHTDPHVWMDPAAWSGTVAVVRDTLIARDPEGAEGYRARAAELVAEIEELGAYGESVLSTVPEERRVLVTAHDAFQYFGRRFGFEVVGIQGISTESEAGVRDIERIVDLLVERGISAVFVESTVSERNIRALLSGAQARGQDVRIGGKLFSDAMGAPGTYEGTYLGMIDHNITLIARALGGDAPEGGMRGRLTW